MVRAPSANSRWLGLGLAALLIPTGATSQQAATDEQAKLQGVVVHESTFEPIEGAVVSVVGTDFETRTGSLGQFAIPDVPTGTAWVRVVVEGLPSVREQVEIKEDGIVFLQFRLADDVTALLDEILVDVRRPDDRPGSDSQSALDLLANKIPGVARHASGDIGDYDSALRLRGFTSLTQDGEPLIVIDNVAARNGTASEVLSRIPASDVASIQVLKGPTAAFRYPFAANGVIQITTRKN